MSDEQKTEHTDVWAIDELKFFELTRAQIQHEDSLLNNRVTRLLTLQAFLFGAYGFSLTAQASLESAKNLLKIAPNIDPAKLTAGSADIANAMQVVSHARIGFALMSFFSSAVLLCGIAAAGISMVRLVKRWERQKLWGYPQIIGRIPRLEVVGGLAPTYALPIAASFVWLWLGLHEPSAAWIVLLGFISVLFIAGVGVAFFAVASSLTTNR